VNPQSKLSANPSGSRYLAADGYLYRKPPLIDQIARPSFSGSNDSTTQKNGNNESQGSMNYVFFELGKGPNSLDREHLSSTSLSVENTFPSTQCDKECSGCTQGAAERDSSCDDGSGRNPSSPSSGSSDLNSDNNNMRQSSPQENVVLKPCVVESNTSQSRNGTPQIKAEPTQVNSHSSHQSVLPCSSLEERAVECNCQRNVKKRHYEDIQSGAVTTTPPKANSVLVGPEKKWPSNTAFHLYSSSSSSLPPTSRQQQQQQNFHPSDSHQSSASAELSAPAASDTALTNNVTNAPHSDNSETSEMLKAIGALTSLRTAIHFSDPDSPRTKRYKVDSSVTVTEVSPGTQATRQVDSSEPNSLTGNFIIKSLCEELARIQERLRILEQRELERERRRLDEEKWISYLLDCSQRQNNATDNVTLPPSAEHWLTRLLSVLSILLPLSSLPPQASHPPTQNVSSFGPLPSASTPPPVTHSQVPQPQNGLPPASDVRNTISPENNSNNNTDSSSNNNSSNSINDVSNNVATVAKGTDNTKKTVSPSDPPPGSHYRLLLPHPLSLSQSPNFQMGPFVVQLVVQPPTRVVYQRILKPYPTLHVLGPHQTVPNLYIEANLLRRDTLDELQYLDGTTLVRVWNGLATFRKLKITSTSQQAGTHFLLRFTLKRYDVAKFIVVPSTPAISDPIEVFSHSQYLKT
jgi:hypothetical protein